MSNPAVLQPLQRYAMLRRSAVAAAKSRRTVQTDRAIAALSTAILFGMIGYMFVGDRPFQPDLAAASEISSINRWVWITLFLLSIPVLWLRRRDVVRLVPTLWPIVMLHLWYIATSTWAIDPAASTRRTIVTCLILVICLAVTVGLRRLERIHLLACVPCMVIIAIDLLSWGAVPGIAMTPLGLQGMHGQKNMLGMYSMYTIVLGATAAWGVGRGWQRRLLLAGVAAAVITLLASRSSTSISITVAAAVILPVLTWLLRRRPVVAAAALLAVFLLLSGALAFYLMWCGLAGADPLAPLAGVTLTQRTDLWAFLLQNIHQRPLGGAGFGSFWAIDKGLQPSLHSGLWFGTGKTIAPEGHNAYLDLAASTGWTGLALGLFVLLRAVARGSAAVHAAPLGMALPTAAFSLGYCLMVAGHSVTESTLYSPNSALGTLFILTAVGLEWARLQARPAALPAPLRTRPGSPASRARPAMPARR